MGISYIFVLNAADCTQFQKSITELTKNVSISISLNIHRENTIYKEANLRQFR